MLHLCLACGLISCVSLLSFQFISLHDHVLGLGLPGLGCMAVPADGSGYVFRIIDGPM